MSSPVLYVHVADDGGVLTIDGGTGRSAWVPASELPAILDGLGTAGGSILLSREEGTPVAAPVLDLVVGSGLPVTIAETAHPDAHRADGSTALMAFAYAGAVHLVADLLARGDDVDARDASGYTALMYAARAGDAEVIDLLLGAGADIAAADHEGSTPLMFAAAGGSLPAVRRLLTAGADAGARRLDGVGPREAAEAAGHARIASVLAAAADR